MKIPIKKDSTIMLSPDNVAKLIVNALDSKNARDIKLLRTTEVTTLADYFVICTANSTTHLKTLTDEVEKILEENGEVPRRREGDRAGGWVLMDYACVVVHLFLEDIRSFYTLERLWSDAEDVELGLGSEAT
ncbi:MAG: ribosome silencing factor [Oscillospiraceae bacterium]|nr:ribosome silencing factor [Oscillospiraceae bacterium]